jgi:hypothetical protein
MGLCASSFLDLKRRPPQMPIGRALIGGGRPDERRLIPMPAD